MLRYPIISYGFVASRFDVVPLQLGAFNGVNQMRFNFLEKQKGGKTAP